MELLPSRGRSQFCKLDQPALQRLRELHRTARNAVARGYVRRQPASLRRFRSMAADRQGGKFATTAGCFLHYRKRDGSQSSSARLALLAMIDLCEKIRANL